VEELNQNGMEGQNRYHIFYKLSMAIDAGLEIKTMLLNVSEIFVKEFGMDAAMIIGDEFNQIAKDNVQCKAGFPANYQLPHGIINAVWSLTESSHNNINHDPFIAQRENEHKQFQIYRLPEFGWLLFVGNYQMRATEKKLLKEVIIKLAKACVSGVQLKLQNRQRRDLESLFNTIDDLLFVINFETQILYYNDLVSRVLECKRHTLFNNKFLDLIPDAERGSMIEAVQSARKGKEVSGNFNLVKSKEQYIPVEIKFIPGVWRGKKVVISIGRDISERLSFEEKLQENSERLEMALFASNAGLWDWDMVTNKLTFNQQWCAMRGFEMGEVKGTLETWKNLLHSDDEKHVLNALNKYMKGSDVIYQAEYRTKKKNGDYIWISDTGKITEYDEKGKPTRMVGTNININDKKLGELELLQNYLQQELLSDIALDINKPDTFDNKINSVLNKIGIHTGVSRVYIFEDDPTGETTSNTFEWCNSGIAPQINDLQNVPYEIIPSWKPIITSKGLLFSEDISTLPGDLRELLEPQDIKSIIIYPLYVKGNFFGFLGFDECTRFKSWTKSELELLRTVSGIIANNYERRIYEESLRESEAKNKAILDSIPDILFHFDSDGRILSFKSASVDELAIQPELFLNKNVDEIFPVDFAKNTKDAITKCIRLGSFQFEYSMEVNGHLTDFEARMSPMNNAEVIAVVRNVSERKEYERQITAERDRANQANRAKSEFLANMSHEIRTPMNAILGFSESLYHKLESPQHKKMLKSVLSSGNLLMSLLNDILDLSKIEAGKLVFSPQAFDLRYIVEEIKMLFTEKACSKGIEIRSVISGDFPEMVVLDEIRIKQVLFNLVGNAIKFTHKGYINIKLDFQKTGRSKGNLTIEVQDTGIGIPENQHQLIFEAFHQQTGQSTRVYQGAGLGLNISKRLVDKMGGSLSVQSKEKQGSCFTVRIDGVEKGAEKAKAKNTATSNLKNISFEPATVMIVDDVHVNIEAVQSLLGNTGLRFMSAENGDMALEILNHTIPELILLDIRMPGKSGYQVAKEIKEHPEFNKIPVIAFTASVIGIEKAEDAHYFDDYIFKPVKKQELLNKLSGFLKVKAIGENQANSFINDTTEISLENHKMLPKVVAVLNSKYIPEWEKIRGNFVLYKIEAFADALKMLAQEYNLPSLKGYAKQLKESAESIDLDAVASSLEEFPIMIDRYRKITQNN